MHKSKHFRVFVFRRIREYFYHTAAIKELVGVVCFRLIEFRVKMSSQYPRLVVKCVVMRMIPCKSSSLTINFSAVQQTHQC